MKNTLLALAIFSATALSASQISEDLAYTASLGTKPSTQETSTHQENIGHITFKLGLLNNSNSTFNLPVFSVGYQSKINENFIFQSSSIEFGRTFLKSTSKDGDASTSTIESMSYYPKIMGIHYWNKDADNRLFVGIGPNLSTYSKYIHVSYEDALFTNSYDTVSFNHSTTSLGFSFAAGIELGKASGAINILKIELDQPALEIMGGGSNAAHTKYGISHTVGF